MKLILPNKLLKNKSRQLLSKYESMEMIFMNTESSKTDESHKFVLDLPQRLDLRSSSEQVALQNLSIFVHLEKYKITVQKQ